MLRNALVIASLPASDIRRATKFYTETLDLQPDDELEPNKVTFAAGDGTLLLLYQQEEKIRVDHTAVTWLVEDLEKAVQTLSEKGVVFEQYDRPGWKTDGRGIADVGGVRGAWFRDTEGNILELTEGLR
jgi:predicted enzyme related to lactoylglutathione lyase